jgi:hypothetical protein
MFKSITISSSNRKIKNANIWNLPTGVTCKPGVSCSKYCYAKKAEKAYPEVLPCRMRNYKASLKNNFSTEMIKLLGKKKYKVTRIHESGDFYSVDYIRKWYNITTALPIHIFYAYTKRDDIFTKELLSEKPSNLILLYSIDGLFKDTDIVNVDMPGYDKIAIVREHNTNCPSTSKDKWTVACIRDCNKCIDKTTNIITFAKH